MYSAVSGLKNFQLKLDVIGNNIANVNTYGYKKNRAVFKDMVYQSQGGASASVAGGRGGTNPKQVGLGSQVSTIDQIATQGSSQSTGRPLDLMINGDGYFMVTDGEGIFYTRAGNFALTEAGDIVNGDGMYLTDGNGTTFTIDPQTTKSFSIGQDGSININRTDGTLDSTQQIQIAKFANAEGLERIGSNLYIVSANSGEQNIAAPGVQGNGQIISNTLEMSNVDLGEEFTEMIVAQRAFQANTRTVTTADQILQELMQMKR